MYKFIFSILLVIAMSNYSRISAQSNPTDDDAIILVNKPKKDDKGRAPSRNYIIIKHCDGTFILNHSESQSLFTLSFYDLDVIVEQIVVSPNVPFFLANLAPGYYDITCTAEDGTVYVGSINLIN